MASYQKQQSQVNTSLVYEAKMAPKAKGFLALSGVVLILSFLLIYFAAYLGYGTFFYQCMQIAAYGGMAAGGVLMVWSSKYNKTRSQMGIRGAGMGLAFLGAIHMLNLLIRAL